MDLCTVISESFIPQAFNLIQSYKINSYDSKVYLYYFNTPREKLKIFEHFPADQIEMIEVPKVCAHAHEPRAFFYKAYAVSDCLTNRTEQMIYSDSANCFIKGENIKEDLTNGCLFMPYAHPKLTNEYWTTERCFKKMNLEDAKRMPQYWAGLQAYTKTTENVMFVGEMLEWMKDPEVALPDTTIKYPDGDQSKCVEHRQDQSILSLLIHKYNKHQVFDTEKNNKYGDWQTHMSFNPQYKHNFDKMVLSPRESKFGQFRFLRNEK